MEPRPKSNPSTWLSHGIKWKYNITKIFSICPSVYILVMLRWNIPIISHAFILVGNQKSASRGWMTWGGFRTGVVWVCHSARLQVRVCVILLALQLLCSRDAANTCARKTFKFQTRDEGPSSTRTSSRVTVCWFNHKHSGVEDGLPPTLGCCSNLLCSFISVILERQAGGRETGYYRGGRTTEVRRRDIKTSSEAAADLTQDLQR